MCTQHLEGIKNKTEKAPWRCLSFWRNVYLKSKQGHMVLGFHTLSQGSTSCYYVCYLNSSHRVKYVPANISYCSLWVKVHFLVREALAITLIFLLQMSKIHLKSVRAVWKLRRHLDIDYKLDMSHWLEESFQRDFM